MYLDGPLRQLVTESSLDLTGLMDQLDDLFGRIPPAAGTSYPD